MAQGISPENTGPEQTEAAAPASGDSWKSSVIWAFRSTHVVTPAGTQPAAVLVRDGKIEAIVGWEEVPAGASLRDYGDYFLLPGLIDPHVHINDAGATKPEDRADWEGFPTATQAAAAGGVTTLVDMPLNCSPETLTVAALEAKRAAAQGRAWVDWMTWGGAVGNAGDTGNTGHLAPLAEAGIPGFKCFLVNSGIETFAWIDESQLRATLSILSGPDLRVLKLPLLAHAEITAPIERATAALLNEDWRSYATYLASRPDKAEVDAIELLVRLVAHFNTPIHIVHLATAEALPLLHKARAAGLPITVETCAHYLWFAAEEIPAGATEYKCAPPIRSAANREALWQALEAGLIDFVVTDHSPCPPALKGKAAGRFDRAWGGIASLGLTLPILWTALTQRSDTADQLAKWLSSEPAKLAGLIGQKGALAAGYDADLVIFDPAAEWTVTQDDLRFRHKLSPYLGAQLRGRVLETYLRGECIFWNRAEGAILDPIAHGRELRRSSIPPPPPIPTMPIAEPL